MADANSKSGFTPGWLTAIVSAVALIVTAGEVASEYLLTKQKYQSDLELTREANKTALLKLVLAKEPKNQRRALLFVETYYAHERKLRCWATNRLKAHEVSRRLSYADEQHTQLLATLKKTGDAGEQQAIRERLDEWSTYENELGELLNPHANRCADTSLAADWYEMNADTLSAPKATSPTIANIERPMNPDMAFEPTNLNIPLERVPKAEIPTPHDAPVPIDPGLVNPNR